VPILAHDPNIAIMFSSLTFLLVKGDGEVILIQATQLMMF
jgi:hypothetical protein